MRWSMTGGWQVYSLKLIHRVINGKVGFCKEVPPFLFCKTPRKWLENAVSAVYNA